MQVLLSFLKLGFYWTLPMDCTVGNSLGGTTRGILKGFPGRVLSVAPHKNDSHQHDYWYTTSWYVKISFQFLIALLSYILVANHIIIYFNL